MTRANRFGVDAPLPKDVRPVAKEKVHWNPFGEDLLQGIGHLAQPDPRIDWMDLVLRMEGLWFGNIVKTNEFESKA